MHHQAQKPLLDRDFGAAKISKLMRNDFRQVVKRIFLKSRLFFGFRPEIPIFKKEGDLHHEAQKPLFDRDFGAAKNSKLMRNDFRQGV